MARQPPVVFTFLFFFNQKPAYEMRISDWSSDVCSSDLSANQLAALERNTAEFGIDYIDATAPEQGIVHVVGPELGFTLPGTTLVCGDSHTSAHGALGALAFGIGTSEVEHVLARSEEHTAESQSTMRI